MRQHTCIHFRQVAINTLQHVSHYRLRNWKAGRSANKLAIDLFDDNTDWQLKRMEKSNERDIGHRIIISTPWAFNIARNHRRSSETPSHSASFRLLSIFIISRWPICLNISTQTLCYRDRNSSQKKKKKKVPPFRKKRFDPQIVEKHRGEIERGFNRVSHIMLGFSPRHAEIPGTPRCQRGRRRIAPTSSVGIAAPRRESTDLPLSFSLLSPSLLSSSLSFPRASIAPLYRGPALISFGQVQADSAIITTSSETSHRVRRRVSF